MLKEQIQLLCLLKEQTLVARVQSLLLHYIIIHHFLFFRPCSVKIEVVVLESHSRSGMSKILRPAYVTPTITFKVI